MATPRPITIYLDSSDYSRLSQSDRSTEMEQVRVRLIQLAELPSVLFVFSGIHISEMAPLESRYTGAASARTDLLVTLCERNALISFDRLVAMEIDCLRRQDPAPVVAITREGTWFPDMGRILTPSQHIDAAREVDQQTRERGLNRKTRRLLKSKTTKHGRLRPEAFKNSNGVDLSDLLERYPIV